MGGRRTAAGGRLDPLWSKAPFLLLRYPGLFASIAVGTLLLALAAAAYPLFISASASELVRARVEDPTYTRWAVGLVYRNGSMPVPGVVPTFLEGASPAEQRRFADAAERTARAFGELTATDPYVEDPLASMLGPVNDIALAGREGETREIRLFSGEGAADHVEIVTGGPDGALVPDTTAEALGIGPGDEIVITGNETSTTVRVGGTFRALYKGGTSGYWGPWNDELVLYCALCPTPPQPVILPDDGFVRAARLIGLEHVTFALLAPLRGELTLEQAEDALRRARKITEAMGDTGTPTGRLFTRCYLSGFCGSRVQATFGSAIDQVVRDVHGRIGALEGPATLLRTAAMLVAIVVVAGAGAFAMAARRVESALLFARGARLTAVGTRAALEALLPVAVGAAAGLGLAYVLVGAIGPRGEIASNASAASIRAGLASGVVAVLAIAAVSTASFLRRSEHHRTRLGVLAAVPWELALVGLALLVFQRLRGGGAVAVDQAFGTTRPSVLLFVFPVVFLAGAVGLAARALVFVLRWARGRSHRLALAPYLAVHRLAARPRLTLVMVTASGLCLGLFVQAQTAARSMQSTVDAKAGVYVGSDVEVRIDHIYETPERFPLPFTRVVRELEAGELSPGVPFDLLAVDPSTFERAAFWDPAFAAEPLGRLVERLGAASGRVPVLLAGWEGRDPTSVTIDTRSIPVEVAGRATAFPGMTTIRPLVVVDQERLVEAFEGTASPLNHPSSSHELWIRGSAEAAREAIPTLPYVPGLVVTADEVKDIPYIAAVIDSFVLMNGLGLLAALLVFAAMLMYLQARQRSEIVSYALSLRMGMRSAGHLAAIAAELGTMLVVAFVTGAVLAVVAARLIVPLVDPLEAIPPDPITVVPTIALVVTGPLLILAALVGGWLTERTARAADLGQVMRLAE